MNYLLFFFEPNNYLIEILGMKDKKIIQPKRSKRTCLLCSSTLEGMPMNHKYCIFHNKPENRQEIDNRKILEQNRNFKSSKV